MWKNQCNSNVLNFDKLTSKFDDRWQFVYFWLLFLNIWNNRSSIPFLKPYTRTYKCTGDLIFYTSPGSYKYFVRTFIASSASEGPECEGILKNREKLDFEPVSVTSSLKHWPCFKIRIYYLKCMNLCFAQIHTQLKNTRRHQNRFWKINELSRFLICHAFKNIFK